VGKGQNLVVAAEDSFAWQQPEGPKGIRLGLRPGTGFMARKDGGSTWRTRQRPLRFHQEKIKFPSRLARSIPVILVPLLIQAENRFSGLDHTNSIVTRKEKTHEIRNARNAGNAAFGGMRNTAGS
jgi:hypothetical protein